MKLWRWWPVVVLMLPLQAAADRVHMYTEGDENQWLGLTVSQINLEFDLDDDELKQQPIAAGFRMGVLPWEYFGAEFRGATGVREGRDRTWENGVREDTLEYLASAFALARVPLIQDFSLRGYVGGSALQVRMEDDLGSDRHSRETFAWGIGGVWRPMSELALTVEYTDYGSKYDLDVEGFEVGALFYF